MKKYWVLTRLSLQSILLGGTGGANTGKRKRRVRSALGAAAIIAFVGLYLSGVYSWMLLEVLSPLRMEALLFMLMGLGSLVMGLLYTSFAVKTAVFGGDDNDLLLSMPVSSTTLMLSRITAIFGESLLFTFFMLVPAGVACAIASHGRVGADVGFWLRLLIAVVSLPLLDTALSLVFGAVIAAVSNRITKKGIGQTLVMGVFLAGVFYLSFNMSFAVEKLALNAAKVRTSLGVVRPVAWMADGIMGSWGDILRFAACCAAPFALAVFVMGKLYRKAVTAFASQAARSDYRLSRQRSAGQTKALLGKEARRFFGTANYFWNAGLGFVMLIAACVALVVKRGTVASLLEMGELPSPALLPLIAMGFMGFCLSTGMIAAPSVSLEGRSLWILREAPVTARTLLAVKTGFQLIVALPCILIAMTCVALSRVLTPGQCLLTLAFGLLYELGHAAFGMLIGLRFAKLDAANEAQVIKQSMLSFLSMFAPMASLAVACGLGWLASRVIPGTSALEAIVGAMVIFAALFAAGSHALLLKKGEKLLAALGEQA